MAYRAGYLALLFSYFFAVLMITLTSANPITAASASVVTRASFSSLSNCDGVGTFICPTGTCHTGVVGFVGCCSVCAASAPTSSSLWASSATSAATSSTPGPAHTTSAPSDASSEVDPDESSRRNNTIIGVSVVAGMLIVSGLLTCLVRAFVPRRSWSIRLVPQNSSPGPFEVPDNSRPSTNASSALGTRNPREPSTLRGRPHISTTDAMNPNDYLSPIARDRMARQAEARDARAEELELDFIQPALYHPSQREGRSCEPRAPHDTSSYSHRANPSTRWSADNAPGPRRNARFRDIASHRVTVTHPYESVDSLILSPSPGNSTDTPAPVRRGSIQHFPTKPYQSWARRRCESPLFGEPMSATGSGSAYVTPETAMADSFAAREDTTVQDGTAAAQDEAAAEDEAATQDEATTQDEAAAQDKVAVQDEAATRHETFTQVNSSSQNDAVSEGYVDSQDDNADIEETTRRPSSWP